MWNWLLRLLQSLRPKCEAEEQTAQTLSELFAELDRLPNQAQTRKEIDRYIAQERATWD